MIRDNVTWNANNPEHMLARYDTTKLNLLKKATTWLDEDLVILPVEYTLDPCGPSRL